MRSIEFCLQIWLIFCLRIAFSLLFKLKTAGMSQKNFEEDAQVLEALNILSQINKSLDSAPDQKGISFHFCEPVL